MHEAVYLPAQQQAQVLKGELIHVVSKLNSLQPAVFQRAHLLASTQPSTLYTFAPQVQVVVSSEVCMEILAADGLSCTA